MHFIEICSFYLTDYITTISDNIIIMNTYRILLYFILILNTFSLNAQPIDDQTVKELKTERKDSLDGWKTGGITSLNISQVGLTNWAAGGQSSLALNGIVSLFANWKKESSTWDNSLDLGYGILKQGEDILLKNSAFVKTDDKIDLTSKYGRRASEKWYYAGLMNFTTQATAGYNYPNDSVRISNFLAPGYLLWAIGMDYKPNKKFNAFISPLTMKTTIVIDQELADSGAFGVEAAELDGVGNVITNGKRLRYEYGGYTRFIYKSELVKNITLTSKLSLFSNYANNPQNIDINWENLLELKVNKFISTTITTHLIYDDDIDIKYDSDGDGTKDKSGPRTQFKEVIGVGFSYKFQ